MNANPPTRRSILLLAGAAACAHGERDRPTGGFSSRRIIVEARGDGPDVVLIPAMAAHRNVWSDVTAALERTHRVHLVQVKGFAGLPPEANAAGPVCAPVAEELARYVDEAGLGAPAVIGHSMGATIAMMLAARYPGAVGRLMIVDMLPWLGGLAGASPADAAVQAAAEQMRSLTLSSQGASIAEMVASQTNGTARGDEMVRYARDSDANTLANAFYELILTDLRAELANIRAPITVLYVVPTHAPLPPDQYEAFLIDSYRGAQHARLIKLEGVGHYMMLSDPAGFQAQVQAFLTR